MKTSFYASGFLYSPKSHKILLLKSQKQDSPDFLWSTLKGESNGGEEVSAAFQRIINELLELNLKLKDIYPVYDYPYDTEEKINYVFYGEVKSAKVLKSLSAGAFSWVAFSEVSKLPFVAHSKQDVIVGERVISAKWRVDEAKREELLVIP